MLANMKRFLKFLAFCVLIQSGNAQVSKGIINGYVVDGDNRPVIDASVLILETGESSITDKTGGFKFETPIGKNTVVVSADGFGKRKQIVELVENQIYELKISFSQKTYDLNTVVVRPEEQLKLKLFKIPSAITAITAEDIEQRGHKSVPELLKSVPGLHASVDSSGTSFFVRGQQVAGGEGIMIYIDGRKAIYAGSNTTGVAQGHRLDDFPIEMIESIEVVKSPAASLYGAGASHGVINITTKKAGKGDQGFYGSVTAGIGDWNTYKANVSVYGRVDNVDYTTTLNVNKTDGYRKIDKTSVLGEVGVGYNFNDENRLGATFGIDKLERLYPVPFVSFEEMQANRDSPRVSITSRAGLTGYQDPTEKESTLTHTGLDYVGNFEGIRIISNFNYSLLDENYLNPGEVWDDGTTGSDETDDRKSKITEFDLSFKKVLFEKDAIVDSLSVGMDYESYDYDNDNNLSGSTSVDTITKRYGFFAHNDFSYGNFSLAAGVRMDQMDWDLKNGAGDDYDGDYNRTSWDVAPSYQISEKLNIFYSVGESVWFPNAFHLSMPSWFGYKTNGPVPGGQVPEENFSHEAGIKHLLSEKFNYSITVYNTKTENKYIASYDAPIYEAGGFTGFKPAGNSTSEGVEISVDGRLSELFEYRANVAWTDTTWDEGTTSGPLKTDISGKKLVNVPALSYSAGVTFYPIEGASISFDMQYDDSAYADASNTVEYDSFMQVDAKVNYYFSKTLSVYFLGSNILDEERYKENSGGMSGASYDPRDGRYLEIGLKKKF